MQCSYKIIAKANRVTPFLMSKNLLKSTKSGRTHEHKRVSKNQLNATLLTRAKCKNQPRHISPKNSIKEPVVHNPPNKRKLKINQVTSHILTQKLYKTTMLTT